MRRRCVLVALIAVTAASLGGLAIARTAPAPTAATSTSTSSRQLGYVDGAIAAVAKRDPRCNTLVEGGSSQGTPTALLPILAVLRRPAGPQDRQSQSSLGALGFADNVYVNYVHRARVAFGQAYYVVPLIEGKPVAGPGRCIAEQRRQLRSILRQIPKPLRSSTLGLAAQVFRGERRVVHPSEAVGLLQVARNVHGGGRSAAGVCCAPASAVAAGHGPGATDGPILSVVVPDRVATFTLSGASPHRKTDTITTRPVGNVVVIRVPYSIRVARHEREILRSANGTVVR